MKRSAFEVSFFQLLNIETPLYVRLELLSTRPHTISARSVTYYVVIPCALVVLLIATYTLSPRVYISGKPLVPMV